MNDGYMLDSMTERTLTRHLSLGLRLARYELVVEEPTDTRIVDLNFKSVMRLGLRPRVLHAKNPGRALKNPFRGCPVLAA